MAVECVIEESHRQELEQLVLSTCRTGRIGDGKLFLLRIVAEAV